MRAVVVTGTDTGVGKTVVTAALAAALRVAGSRVAVVKPVQTGVALGEPGDLDEVRRLAGIDDLHEFAPLSRAARAGDGRAPIWREAAGGARARGSGSPPSLTAMSCWSRAPAGCSCSSTPTAGRWRTSPPRSEHRRSS